MRSAYIARQIYIESGIHKISNFYVLFFGVDKSEGKRWVKPVSHAFINLLTKLLIRI